MAQRRHSEPAFSVNTHTHGPIRARFENNTIQADTVYTHNAHRYIPSQDALIHVPPRMQVHEPYRDDRQNNIPNILDEPNTTQGERQYTLHSTLLQNRQPTPSDITNEIYDIPPNRTYTNTDRQTLGGERRRQETTGAETFIGTNMRQTQGIRNLIDFEDRPAQTYQHQLEPRTYDTQTVHPNFSHYPNNNTHNTHYNIPMKTIQAWNIKYTGAENEDAYEFIQCVRDLQIGYDIADTDLIKNLAPILHGDARQWYRLNRGSWNTLDEFERDFLHAFQDTLRRDSLEDEIRNYIQKDTQKITPFLTQIRILMNQLTPPYTIQKQLQIAYRNLRFEYQSYIKPYEFANFYQLEQAGKQWEANVARHKARQNTHTTQNRYQPRTTNTNTQPTDSTQTQPRRFLLPTPNIPPTYTHPTQTTPQIQPTQRTAITYTSPNYTRQQTTQADATVRRCFNCNEPGHMRWQCTKPQRSGNE